MSIRPQCDSATRAKPPARDCTGDCVRGAGSCVARWRHRNRRQSSLADCVQVREPHARGVRSAVQVSGDDVFFEVPLPLGPGNRHGVVTLTQQAPQLCGACLRATGHLAREPETLLCTSSSCGGEALGTGQASRFRVAPSSSARGRCWWRQRIRPSI